MNAPSRADRRMPQLDGLRGVAALVVLFAHALATIPSIGAAYYGWDPAPMWSFAWWVNHTPLKLFSAGGEAVQVFFVLSGLVVTLPALRFGIRGWIAYYPRRIIRLGVPLVAAVLWGYLLASLIPRYPDAVGSEWLAVQAPIPSLHGLLTDLAVFPADFGLNNPLWSIRWELIFSLALPIYVVLVRFTRRVAPLLLAAAVIGCCAVMGVGMVEIGYLLMFAIGALMAVLLQTLQRLGDRVSRMPGASIVWSALAVFAALALISWWLTGQWIGAAPPLVQYALHGIPALGATMLVWIAMCWQRAIRFLTARPASWLGRVSFSLYLVHVPIIATVGFAAGGRGPIAVVVLAVPLALVTAQAFARFVEMPSHRLARRAGDLALTLAARRRPVRASAVIPA